MVNVTISIGGAKDLWNAIERLRDLNLRQAINNGCILIMQDLGHYPPLTEGNMPPAFPPGRFYVRHVGGMYIDRQGRISQISYSQRLGKSWQMRLETGLKHIRGIVGTTVTYAPNVHDRHRQEPYHTRHGWRTTYDILNYHKTRIVSMIESELKKALAK